MAGSALLRQARREDALRLHELHTASVRTLCDSHYAAEIIGGWLQTRSAEGYLAPIKRGVLFVAQRDDRIIGFGEIRQGVGSALLRHALERARLAHRGPVRVESTLNAIGFYAKHGFGKLAEGRPNAVW